jgi:hypothetical protein
MRHNARFQTPRWVRSRLFVAAVLGAAFALSSGRSGVAPAADEPAAGTQATPPSQTKSTGKKAKGDKTAKARGRLPSYFSGVVTDEQRETIYAIQKEYEPTIKELTLKLDSLRKERDEKINALLSPEQKKKIDDLKAAARQARDKKETAGSKEKESGTKPTPPEPKSQPAKPKPTKSQPEPAK